MSRSKRLYSAAAFSGTDRAEVVACVDLALVQLENAAAANGYDVLWDTVELDIKRSTDESRSLTDVVPVQIVTYSCVHAAVLVVLHE